MDDFKFDPKLWDTLDDDQKKLLNEAKEQITASNKKSFEKDYQSKVEAEKAKITEQLAKEQQDKEAKNSFLGTVPASKQKLVSTLLEAGKTPEQIKADFPDLTEPDPMPAGVMEHAFGTDKDETKPAPQSDKPTAEQIAEWTEKGIDPKADAKTWEMYGEWVREQDK